MANEALRRAIRAAGLSFGELAERVRVDVKTVERWVWQDRVPHAKNRQAVVRALHVSEQDLWAVPDRWDGGPAQGKVDALQAEVVTLRARLQEAELLLWGLAEGRAMHLLGRHLTITNVIGRVPEDDVTIDTRLMESADASRAILYLLYALTAAGDRVPPRSNLGELERVEAWELLDNGRHRPCRVHHLGHREGKIWAIVFFDREQARVNSRMLWSWAGSWNPLRTTGRDSSNLDLRPPALNVPAVVRWDTIRVEFQFPPMARGPEVWTVGLAPSIVPTETRDDAGGVTYTFELEEPDRLHYSWGLAVERFDAP